MFSHMRPSSLPMHTPSTPPPRILHMDGPVLYPVQWRARGALLPESRLRGAAHTAVRFLVEELFSSEGRGVGV
eukprot:160041-Chlamydomonas_euryale.AAC.2